MLLAVVVGVPVLLTALHLDPHSLPTIHQIGTTLRERDNGGLAVGVIAGAAWLCWALFTLSLVPEVAALARRARPESGRAWVPSNGQRRPWCQPSRSRSPSSLRRPSPRPDRHTRRHFQP